MWLLGKKDGCAHDSEDDSTDESDLEEGEVEDNSDEEEGVDKGEGQAEKQKPLVSQEVLAKLNHPERLHKFMCYNDKGEVLCYYSTVQYCVTTVLYGVVLLQYCTVLCYYSTVQYCITTVLYGVVLLQYCTV